MLKTPPLRRYDRRENTPVPHGWSIPDDWKEANEAVCTGLLTQQRAPVYSIGSRDLHMR